MSKTDELARYNRGMREMNEALAMLRDATDPNDTRALAQCIIELQSKVAKGIQAESRADGLSDALAMAKQALSDVLAIVDSDSAKAESASAWIHGVHCAEDVSKKNGETIDAAYKLLGRKRPL